MQIHNLYHTGFIVSDIERSVDFYTRVLGMRVERKPTDAGGPWLGAVVGYPDVKLRIAFVGPGTGHSIELIQYVEPSGGKRQDIDARNVVGAAHCGMVVDDVRAWYDRLKAEGVRVMGEPTLRDVEFPWARYAFYFQDPDGHKLELATYEV